MKTTPRAIIIGILVLIVVIAGVVWFVPSLRALVLDSWQRTFMREASVPFALYENGAFAWYQLSGTTVEAGTPPEGVVPGIAAYPNGNTLSITAKGLEWHSAAGADPIVILAREGMTPESSVVASDGTSAVLFNQITNSFDVFSITYEGGYQSYVGSIPMPASPSYLIAIGIIPPSTIVMRTGSPDAFELYRIEGASVTHTGTAALKGALTK